jgi:type IV pilus assembly protein PilO
MALDQKQQRQIFFGAIFVIAAGLYWYLLYKPDTVNYVYRRQQVDTLMALNREIQKLAAGGSLAAMREEAKEFDRQLAGMRKLVPAANEVPALIDGIASAARSAGLELSDLKPAGQLPGDQFDIYKFDIGVIGPYHRVGTFLTNIGSMERIIAPMNLKLLMGPPNVGTRRPRANEVFVVATFQIQTYVAKTLPPPATPPGAATPGGQ